MIWLFAPSLVLGMIPAILLGRASSNMQPNTTVRNLWNSAIATLSAGMLVRAIINISGRYTEYDTIYWIASGVLFALAAAVYVKRTVLRRRLQTRYASVIEG